MNSVRRPWIAFALLFTFFYVWILALPFFPNHDTVYPLMWFQYFYSNFDGTVPAWIPYIHWGMPSVGEFMSLSLTQYLMALVGWTFHSKDVVTLFWLSLALEELIFIYSVYRFSKHLYRLPAVRFTVTFAAWASTIYIKQIWFCLRILVWIPLCLTLILEGHTERDSRKTVLAYLISISLILAGLTYLTVIHLLVVFAFHIFCFWQYPLKSVGKPRFYPLTLVYSALFFAVAGWAVYLKSYTVQAMEVLTRPTGRIANVYTNYLQWVSDDSLTSARGMVSGIGLEFDSASAYLGYILLALVPLAMLRPWRRITKVMFCLAAFSIILWLGRFSFLAHLLFLLPEMSIFRHFALLSPLPKLFVLFLAGFGMQNLILNFRPKAAKLTQPIVTFAFWASVAIVPVIIGEIYQQSVKLNGIPFQSLRVIIIGAIWLSVLGMNLSPHLRWKPKHIAAAILTLVLIDCASVKFFTTYNFSVLVSSEFKQLFFAHPVKMPEKRYRDPLTNPSYRLFECANSEAVRDNVLCDGVYSHIWPTIYAIMQVTVQAEPCWTSRRAEFISTGNRELYATQEKDRPKFDSRIACEKPLLQIVDDPGNLETEVKGATWSTLKYTSNFVSVSTSSPRKAFLYYADSWDRRWSVKVNGINARLNRVQDGFKGVEIPEGTATVEFSFDHSVYTNTIYLLFFLAFIFPISLFYLFKQRGPA